MVKTKAPLHIIKLVVSNIKRISAVTIEPDGNLVVLTGKNSQGKSSVMDAIWLVFQYKSANKQNPRTIKKGADKGEVSLDLGEFVVTRTWKRNKEGEETSAIKITNADGHSLARAQTVIDELLGNLCFDPLEFTKLGSKAQVDELMQSCGLGGDLANLEAERKALYESRADVNREAKKLEGKIALTPEPEEGLPEEESSALELMEKIKKADDQNFARRNAAANRERRKSEVESLEKQLALARKDLKESEEHLEAMPDYIDLDDMKEQLANVEETNKKVRAAQSLSEAKAELSSKQSESKELTKKIDAISAQKSEIVKSAGLPVEGLEIVDDGLQIDGIPFVQCSTAQQIKLSTAIAMAGNPRLRVILIMEATLLDSEAWAEIERQAKENNFQVWMEVVERSVDGAFEIVDGRLAGDRPVEDEPEELDIDGPSGIGGDGPDMIEEGDK